MAALFPEGPQISSTEDEYSFSHMTAEAIENGESFSAIAIDSNTGKIYVVDSCARVVIFSDTLEFLKTLILENMVEPCGIVIHNDSMYLTDTNLNYVFHFKVTGDSLVFIDEIEGDGLDIELYDEPRHLDVSITGYVYVADCYNDKIKVHDENLHYIRHISHPSMTRPIDVKLTPDKVYVLCDFNTLSIHVFSHFGNILQSLILRESRTEAWTNSSCFSIDSRGNFVITDSLSDIQIFSKEGELIHTLGSHELGLESLGFDPKFIVAQTVNGKLLVVLKDNDQTSKSKAPSFQCCLNYLGISACVKVRFFSL